MARNRNKGNRVGEPFLALPYSVLNSQKFTALSARAVKLLIDVAAQYRGDNNGDLSTAWKLMQPRGWRSEETLHRAKLELVEAGFLFETRKGYRPNTCSLFALTWAGLDDGTKFDAGAAVRFRRGEYRDALVAPVVVIHRKNAALTTPAVAGRAA
jgi:hypothetical protein